MYVLLLMWKIKPVAKTEWLLNCTDSPKLRKLSEQNTIVFTASNKNWKSTALPKQFCFCRFTACVATSGWIVTSGRLMSLQWMAFESSDLPAVGFAKVQDIPLWTTGTKCVLVDTGSKVKAEVLCHMLIGLFVENWALGGIPFHSRGDSIPIPRGFHSSF